MWGGHFCTPIKQKSLEKSRLFSYFGLLCKSVCSRSSGETPKKREMASTVDFLGVDSVSHRFHAFSDMPSFLHTLLLVTPRLSQRNAKFW